MSAGTSRAPSSATRERRPPSEHGGRQLRLFVAVELPEDVKRALARTIDALRAAGATAGVRYVRPDGIHVTLKFLGATPEDRVPSIDAALRHALMGAPTFDLQPGALGSFGGRRSLRVIWVGLACGAEALSGIAERVESALAALGYPGDRRPFAAHLTLARLRDEATPSDRQRIYDIITRIETPPSAPVTIDHVSLMQSTLSPGGAVYTALRTYALTRQP